LSPKLQTMTEGPLGKQIFLYSVPIIFTNVLQAMFNMADIAVVGQFAGSLALGAVGSTSMIVMIFTGFLMGIGTGVNVLAARFFGARDIKSFRLSIHTSAVISLIIGLLLAFVGIVFARPLLTIMNTKPELIDGAVLYLQIYFAGLPAMALYNYGRGVLSAVGDTKRPLYYLFISGAINVVLNLVFVIAFRMDVAGVALASIIAQYVSAVMILFTLFRSDSEFKICISEMKLDRQQSISLLTLGLPAAFQNSIFYIANVFVQIGVNSFSATVVSGNSAATNSDTIVYCVFDAIYVATASFISQNYGARKRERIMKSYAVCTVYAFGAGIILGALLLLLDREFLSVFTSDPAVIDAGLDRLHVMAISYCISTFMDNALSASRGLGKSVVPTVIVIMGSCVFRIIWIYTVFAYFQTITSLYLLYSFSWAITAIAANIYFFRCYRKMQI